MSGSDKVSSHSGCGCSEEWQGLLPAGVSLVLLFLLLAADRWMPLVSPFRLFAYVIAFLPVGCPVLRQAVGEALHGEWFNEFLLMAVAAFGAFYLGEYPEAVAVMLFYSVGEYCQDKAVERAHRSIRALVDLRPAEVSVVDSGGRKLKRPEEVEVGEVIEVPVGGRVPLDAILLSDASRIDASALTGESVPRLVETGMLVPSGVIVLERPLQLRVVHPYNESAMARVLKMVEEASDRKASAELFIRRFARVYTPTVILLAVLIALVPSLVLGFSENFGEYLHRALVFLVISCPCALVISIPLGYFSGIGIASHRGILFKGGNYLDAAAKVTDVVFDKTGTLTHGRFAVDGIVTFCEMGKTELLSILAGMEAYSTHPLARALMAYAEKSHIEPVPVKNLQEVAGMGLKADVNGCVAVVGNARWMEKNGLKIPDMSEKMTGTVLYCGYNGQLIGCAVLRDRPKEDARRAVAALKKMGISSVSMLSGDRQSIVDGMVSELDLDYGDGDLLPEQKVEYLKKQLGHERRTVAFVGDGINDAPALALSDVGFAMGDAGSDIAVETADVVLQSGSPVQVAFAVIIGRTTRQVVMANICMALGVKLLVMVLGAFGMANLWMAVFADSGVALLCVLNVVTLQRFLTDRRLKKL